MVATMARLLTTIALLAGVIAFSAAPAQAGKRCDLGVYYETISHVQGVSCKKAEKVIRAYLDDEMQRFGFTCRQKQDAFF